MFVTEQSGLQVPRDSWLRSCRNCRPKMRRWMPETPSKERRCTARRLRKPTLRRSTPYVSFGTSMPKRARFTRTNMAVLKSLKQQIGDLERTSSRVTDSAAEGVANLETLVAKQE